MQKAIAPGAVIERRYQIQKKTSNNTCNCCYLAKDSNDGNRLVVLSFPRIELLILPGFASAFKDACENLANARIGGVVKVLGNGLYESQPYAVLPHITHDSLEILFHNEVKAKQKVSLESVLDWAAPLAVSLDELHEADYIHSNVRPDSIYISKQQVVLGDFITEFALQRMGKFKSAISTLDVSDHLAPEYLKSFYTPSYDQYLLATLVYQSLAGETQFAPASSGDDYRMHVATIIAKPLTDYRPELNEVSEVLVKALSRNPANRFASCRELISQLQEAQPETSTPTTSKVVTLKPALKDESVAAVVETPTEPIITPVRQENFGGKGRKGLMWLGVLLLGSAAVAYTVISQNGADQIMSNNSRDAVPLETEANAALIKAVSSDSSQYEVVEKEIKQSDTETAEEIEAKKVDAAGRGELRNLIQKEALLAHKALSQSERSATSEVIVTSREPVSNTSASKSAPVPQDFSGLAAIVNQAVNAGEKDFLEAKNRETGDSVESANPEVSTEEPTSDDQTTNVEANENSEAANSGNDTEFQEVSEASETLEVELTEQEKLNQELLQAQALVNARESEARKAAEKSAKEKKEAEQAKKRAEVAEKDATNKTGEDQGTGSESVTDNQSTAEDSVSVIAVGRQAQSAQVDGEVDSSQTIAVANESAATTLQSQVQERQRIQAFKQKEIARIKAVTNDCTIGGKIHREAAAGNLSFVKACMAVGVDPNVAQSNRWTLLHIAARSGHLNMSKLLIAKGARVNAKSSRGLTALDMATAQKKNRVVNYLKTRGGVTTR